MGVIIGLCRCLNYVRAGDWTGRQTYGEDNMIEVLRHRRSIRKYEKRSLDHEAVEILKESILRSPSARGINPWEFVFVDDPDTLMKLAHSKEQGSVFLLGAALGIVVCGDETKSDVWVEDCSIASIIVQLAAHSIGLGTCWIQIRNRMHSKEITAEEYVRGLLRIPGNLRVESIISIGYPGEAKTGVSGEQLMYGRIRHNTYE